MTEVKLIEVRSELGAGTPGPSLGVDALKIACLNRGSDYFARYDAVEVPHRNHLLFQESAFAWARHIDGVLATQRALCDIVASMAREGSFPIVLSGDHSSAVGVIAGLKRAFPERTLGVVWIDAHTDCNSPYTTPSGNLHGMPLAVALGDDNLACRVNDVDPSTALLWEEMKSVGAPGPKIHHRHIVYVMARDAEAAEWELCARGGIYNVDYDEMNAKGPLRVAEEVLARLDGCDAIYVSFDVDSLDPSLSRGTGLPVARGLGAEQAIALCARLMRSDKVIAYEISEINPTLDDANATANIAFDVLEAATAALLAR